ncbi:MAG: methionyl-tRNA formyltransferase [Pseudomonadota bacterium]
MTPPARIGFAGTPEFARTLLAGLIDGGWQPAVVYTQPDRPHGRGRKLRPSPVRALAEAAQLPVETPRTLRDPEAQAVLQTAGLDLLIVAAYGLILPQAVLDLPRLGCLNVHASLLPRWRGAAPIERAIMAGDDVSGVSLMQMEAGLDTGPVHATVPVPIDGTTTGPALEAALAQAGITGLLKLLPRLADSQPEPQDDSAASYAHKLTPEDARIDWRADAARIDRQVRALCGRAPAFATLADAQPQSLRLAILEATSGDPTDAAPGTVVALDKRAVRIACGDKLLNVRRAQLNRGQGKALNAADLRNALRDTLRVGTRLDLPT